MYLLKVIRIKAFQPVLIKKCSQKYLKMNDYDTKSATKRIQQAFLQLHSGYPKQPRIHLINLSSPWETQEKFCSKVGNSVLEKI